MGYSFQRYENYKKVDNLAFDELPVEWTLKKVKHLFTIGRGRVISQEELDDNGVFPVYSSQTQNNGCLGFINTYDFDCKQITWTTDGANAGTVFLREGKHNCTNVCGTLQPISKNLNFSFYLYSLQYVTQFHKRPDTNGAKIMNGEMAAISLCIPSDYEQQKIANFLDYETAKIDILICKQEKLIKLLKEKRQAVISHAVTKGLNPDARMKDSGVEWLGEVPEHWGVSKLKYLVTEPLLYGANEAALDTDRSNPRFIRITDVKADGALKSDTFRSLPLKIAQPYMLNDGDILLARSGGTVGKSFIYRKTWGKCCFAGYLIKASINKEIVSADWVYLNTLTTFYWEWIGSSQIQATIQNVSAEKYNSFSVAIPPKAEVQAITEYLNSKLAHFDRLIEKALTAIGLMKERKTALISAAVTGKIDVRDWQQPTEQQG